MENDSGVILFNVGERCIVRSIVALSSLRKFWSGNVTFFLEEPYPKEFDNVCKYFGVDIQYVSNPNSKALVRSAEVCLNTPYEKTLWLDSDTVTVGNIDEMFSYLNENEAAIPHFSGWYSDGKKISRRIKRYYPIVKEEYINIALNHHPAINTGIFSFRKNIDFLYDWIGLAQLGQQLTKPHKIFIPDEIAWQILYPNYPSIYVAPQKYNVSPLYGNGIEDARIYHYHGQKHVLSKPTCDVWKKEFSDLMDNNTANIRQFTEKYPDKRLKIYMSKNKDSYQYKNVEKETFYDIVTIVTACDEKYYPILKETYKNWKKYKNINMYPIIVFIDAKIKDYDFSFITNENKNIIVFDGNFSSQREKMLSSFVIGTAKHVLTPYWLKLDSDSFATDDKPLLNKKMMEYYFCGHKWGYSFVDHIKSLDKWAQNHSDPKLNSCNFLINDGKVAGRRFYHNRKRTISFIQLHQTEFSRLVLSLLDGEKLPAPSQDTFYYYVAAAYCPSKIGTANFKKDHGFTQGNGRMGEEFIVQQMKNIGVYVENI